MKKTTLLLLITICIFGLHLPVSAAGSADFTLRASSSQIRVNDTLTITGELDATESVATFDLTVNYPNAFLQYTKAEGLSAISDGEMDISPNTGAIQFLYLDDDGGDSGLGSSDVFRITFKVIGGATGDDVSVGINVKTVGNKNAEPMDSSGTGITMKIAQPLSTNSFLSSMTISNAAISPAFSKNTTSYSATVPFSVSRLEVSASPEDAKARVAVSGQDLSVGTNTVYVVVTAENGSKKTYSINVTREQDPDYEASDNADLKSITPSAGILSPVFDPARTLYNVYLPFEISSFDAAGISADPKASGVEREAIDLEVGENTFVMTGIAEDGTRKDYKIMVIRMPALGEEMPDPTPKAEEDKFTLSGTLYDSNGDPLSNMTVELHSKVMTTKTNAIGFYIFENVVPGEHTLYVKDEADNEMASIAITIAKGFQTAYEEGVLTVRGDTKFDITVKDNGIEIANVMDAADPGSDPVVNYTGIPWWVAALLAIAACLLGILIGRIAVKKSDKYSEEDSGRIMV